MSQAPRDKKYDQAQARLVRDASRSYQTPDWGTENPRTREAYDRELARTLRANGRKSRR
ncbi:hypothetical protein [Nonomuraea ceibae]|uniref:hypothetical protein n=1 Tax=Nonomuraea ceibae TaxID=1935170 RepID=UPI001C606AA4|nr:hypothetical protein [Nonomuraea ceibae]